MDLPKFIIVVEWDRKTTTISKSGDVSLKQSTWSEKTYDGTIFTDMPYPESIWDEETIMEDQAGDLHFTKTQVLDIWEAKIRDEGVLLDEDVNESASVIAFAKWVRDLPIGSVVHIIRAAPTESQEII